MSEELFTIPFFHYSQSTLEKIRASVQRMSSGEIDGAEALISKMVADYRLTELIVDWKSLKVLPNHREEESHYNDAFGDDVRTVTPIYTFEVKYSGSSMLFGIQPSSSRLIRLEAQVRDDMIQFEVKGSDKSRLEQIKEGISFNLENQKREVAAYNTELEKAIRTAVERRQQELSKHNDGLNAFGVPVKDQDNLHER